MFGPDKTVYILGAGASWHYGYPTGEQLVRKIVEKAHLTALYFEQSAEDPPPQLPKFIKKEFGAEKLPLAKLWSRAAERCAALRDGLKQVNPLLIDYYLGWNPELQSVGRLFIAWVILECEKNYLKYRFNINRAVAENGRVLTEAEIGEPAEDRSNIEAYAANFRDDWCRFVIHQLAIDCRDTSDLLRNHVRFVTFNYDVSLERSLYEGLSHIKLFELDDIKRFLSAERILHVYGRARSDIFQPLRTDMHWIRSKKQRVGDPRAQGHYKNRLIHGTLDFHEEWVKNKQWATLELAHMNQKERAEHHSDWTKLLDYLLPASLGIRVIDPEEKAKNEKIIRSARKAISEAQRVYILGYGFDENNCNRLELRKALDYRGPETKRVHFTNFRNVNRVNKRAGKLYFDNEAKFPARGGDVERGGQWYYERSIRDVYEALELDFD